MEDTGHQHPCLTENVEIDEDMKLASAYVFAMTNAVVDTNQDGKTNWKKEVLFKFYPAWRICNPNSSIFEESIEQSDACQSQQGCWIPSCQSSCVWSTNNYTTRQSPPSRSSKAQCSNTTLLVYIILERSLPKHKISNETIHP